MITMQHVPLMVSVVLLSIMVSSCLAVAVVWHLNPKTEFDLRQALVDSVTGKIAIEKVGYMVALGLSSWGFVTLTLMGQLTEMYFATFMTAFTLARVASQGMAIHREVKMRDGQSPDGVS